MPCRAVLRRSSLVNSPAPARRLTPPCNISTSAPTMSDAGSSSLIFPAICSLLFENPRHAAFEQPRGSVFQLAGVAALDERHGRGLASQRVGARGRHHAHG